MLTIMFTCSLVNCLLVSEKLSRSVACLFGHEVGGDDGGGARPAHHAVHHDGAPAADGLVDELVRPREEPEIKADLTGGIPTSRTHLSVA